MVMVRVVISLENQIRIQNTMRRYHHHHHHHHHYPIKTTVTSRILATFFTAFASRHISSCNISSNQRVVAEAFTTTTTNSATHAFCTTRHCRNSRFAFDNNNPSLQRSSFHCGYRCSSHGGTFSSSSSSSTCRSMTTTTTATTASSCNHNNNDQLHHQHQQRRHQGIIDMQNALYRIRAVNNMPIEIRQSLLEFRINGIALGKVRPAVAEMLVQTDSTVFQLQREDDNGDDDDDNNDSNSSSNNSHYLTLASTVGTTCAERSAAINSVMVQLRNQGLVKGWRDENYPVAATFHDDPIFVMERAAVHYLGVLEYGVHINGLVDIIARNEGDNDDNNNSSSSNSIIIPEQKMWIARRSATKSKFPGMLDHIVAGGQPVGMSLLDNCIKECAEEAGIPEHITRAGLRPAGAISYETYSASLDTVTRAVLFCFDLYLPNDFIPSAIDGEVQEFMTWSVPQLLASLSPDFDDPIKPNCYPVMIDWLVRQGHLSPDVPGYLNVLRELRSGDCQ